MKLSSLITKNRKNNHFKRKKIGRMTPGSPGLQFFPYNFNRNKMNSTLHVTMQNLAFLAIARSLKRPDY
jgi:hypothetical protein